MSSVFLFLPVCTVSRLAKIHTHFGCAEILLAEAHFVTMSCIFAYQDSTLVLYILYGLGLSVGASLCCIFYFSISSPEVI